MFYSVDTDYCQLYRMLREAEANRLKLTPEYLELRFIEAISNNSKIFFGDKVSALHDCSFVCSISFPWFLLSLLSSN